MPQPFQMGEWLVRPDLNAIVHPSLKQNNRVEGKIMEVLLHLAHHQGQVVSKASLLEKIWDGSFVSDDVLFRSIRELRRLLGDDAKNPRYIQTIPKKGYRLIAPIRPCSQPASVHEETAAQLPPPAARRLPRSLWMGLSLVLSLMVLGLGLHFRSVPGNSLAVVPFLNLTGSEELDYLSIGLADGVAYRLSQVDDLTVVSSTTALKYLGRELVPAEIARDLRVGVLLLGKLMMKGDEISLSAELVDGSANRLIWGGTFRFPLSEVVWLEEQLAAEIAQRLRIETMVPEETPVTNEAYDSYLRGRYHWSKTSRQGFQQAVEYFSQALRQDPGYAAAYSGLADAHALRGFYGFAAPKQAFALAEKAALKALELNDTLAESHTSLAALRQVFRRDWKGAEESYRRALRLNPNYPTAHHWYGLFYLLPLGRFREAEEQMELALARSPLSLRINMALAFLYYVAGNGEKAFRQLEKMGRIEPRFPPAHSLRSLLLVEQGRGEEARREARLAVELGPELPLAQASLAYVLARSGEKTEAEQMLSELLQEGEQHYVSPYDVGLVVAALGRAEEALDWLERAASEYAYECLFLRVDPRLKGLRLHPRLQLLAKSLGFP